MAARGQRDEALEPRFVDLDIAGCSGNHLASIDQERLGGIGADRNLAGDRDGRAVEDVAAYFDAVGILGIETVAAAKVEQPRYEAPLLLGQRAADG